MFFDVTNYLFIFTDEKEKIVICLRGDSEEMKQRIEDNKINLVKGINYGE